jgi:AraC-like DNA-binding protein
MNIKLAAERAAEAQEKHTDSWMTRQYMYLIEILMEIEQFAADYRSSGQAGIPIPTIADSVGFLLEHYREALNTETLIQHSGVGKTSFFKEFRTLTGQTPNEFVNLLRVQNAMELLRTTDHAMIEVAEDSGFQSLSTFNKQFKRQVGTFPREYRTRMQHRSDNEK